MPLAPQQRTLAYNPSWVDQAVRAALDDIAIGTNVAADGESYTTRTLGGDIAFFVRAKVTATRAGVVVTIHVGPVRSFWRALSRVAGFVTVSRFTDGRIRGDANRDLMKQDMAASVADAFWESLDARMEQGLREAGGPYRE